MLIRAGYCALSVIFLLICRDCTAAASVPSQGSTTCIVTPVYTVTLDICQSKTTHHAGLSTLEPCLRASITADECKVIDRCVFQGDQMQRVHSIVCT